jgi:hypothetical protein
MLVGTGGRAAVMAAVPFRPVITPRMISTRSKRVVSSSPWRRERVDPVMSTTARFPGHYTMSELNPH